MKPRNRWTALVLFVSLVLCVALISPNAVHAAGKEETIAGFVIKTDKGLVIEAEDGEYLVKGKDLSKMVGKMIEATGTIIESEKGDTIEVKSFEEIQE